MKNKKKLIIIIVSIVVLLAAGALLFLGLRNRNVKYSDLGKITYMKYSVNGEEYEVVKKDDVWYWKDREDLFIENVSIDMISKTARKELRIEEAQTNESLKKLGLKDPEYSLTLKDSKGRKITFHVGKQVSVDTYFVQNGSDKKVYTASEQIMGVIDSLMAMRSVSEQMEVVGQ